MLVPIAIYVLLVNVATAAIFAIDKGRAGRGQWRVRESTLLGLAFFGGSAGAVWARRRFRHKTRKRPCSTRLDLIAMLHVGLITGSAVTFLL